VWPQMFVEFMAKFEILDLELFSMVPAECLGKQRLGFPMELYATLAFPILVFLVPFLLLWCFALFRQLVSGKCFCFAGFCRLVGGCFRCIRGVIVGTWRCIFCCCLPQRFRPKREVAPATKPKSKKNKPTQGVIAAACSTACEQYTHSRSFKLTTLGLLLVYPTISRKCLSAFSCVPAVTEDGVSTFFMREDPVIVCFEGEWYGLATASILGLVIYCFGLPVLAIGLILRARAIMRRRYVSDADKTEARERVSLLTSSYEPGYWYMESVWLAHKFFFTGVIHLFAFDASLQIYVGTLVALVSFLGALLTKPYKYDICDFVQNVVLLQLLFTYITAFLLLRRPGEEIAGASATGSTLDEDTLAIILISINMSSFILLTILMVYNLRQERRKQAALLSRRLVFRDGTLPTMPDLELYNLQFHIFLSHCWGTGQDQMRVVKKHLIEILPESKIFLDVDDLKEGRGREYMDVSAQALVFVSDGYFVSPNCMRELLRAFHLKKPIITLQEQDQKKGGLTPEQVRRQLHEADAMLTRWGLSEELEEWNCPRPTPDQLYDALDIEGLRGTPLLWERLTDFQRITLRLVCERFLGHEGLKYGDDVAAPKIELPQHGLGFHAYCSPHNHRAKDVLHELATVLSTNVVTEPYVRPRPRWGGRSGSWGSGSMFSARESFSRNKSSCRADPSQAERLSRPRPSAAKARLRSTATDDEVDTPSETPSGATWLRRAPSASKHDAGWV